MATATKTPAKRATSQTNAAAAPKSTRTSARTASGAVKAATSKGAGAAAKTAAGASKKTAVKRALNGASAPAHVGSSAASSLSSATRRTKASSAKASRAKPSSANGALPAELAGDVQELARVAKTRENQEGEIVRKTRASSSAGGEAASASEVAVPVQIAGLAPEVTRPDYWDKACADLVKRDRILKKLIPKFGPVHLLSRGDP